MTTWTPKCPHCGSRDLELFESTEEASDRSENIETTHRCKSCLQRFRVVPPDHVEVWP